MSRLLVLPLFLAVGCLGPSSRVVDEIQIAIPADGLEAARLVQGIGDADVIGAPDATEVILRVVLRGPAADDHGDQAALDDLRVELESCGDRVCARSELDGGHIRYGLDTELLVPARFAVHVDDGLGDLRIRDVASLEVRDGSGDLDVTRIAGSTRIEDDLGDTTIFDVGGPVDVRDGSGDLDIERVIGAVTVRDDLGDLRIDDVIGNVSIIDGSGDIRVRQVRGDVEITDDLGDIEVQHITGTLTILADTTGDVRTDGVQRGSMSGD